MPPAGGILSVAVPDGAISCNGAGCQTDAGAGEENGTCTIRWSISDTGIGMDEAFVKKIFEPFEQEKQDARSTYQGTGLGMSIVKSLVEQMNGAITVVSRKGEGTTFVVTIPFEIAKEPVSAAGLPAAGQKKDKDKGEAAEKELTGLHVLVAEDNDLNAHLAKPLDVEKLVRVIRKLCG